MGIIERAFIAGRSKQSWEDFKKENEDDDIKDLFEDGEAAMIKLLPPEQFGEDSDADVLYMVLETLRDHSLQSASLKAENDRLREALKQVNTFLVDVVRDCKDEESLDDIRNWISKSAQEYIQRTESLLSQPKEETK